MTVYTRYKEDTPSDATKLPHWLGKLLLVPIEYIPSSMCKIEFTQRTP